MKYYIIASIPHQMRFDILIYSQTSLPEYANLMAQLVKYCKRQLGKLLLSVVVDF